MTRPLVRSVEISVPAWVEEVVDPGGSYSSDAARMRVAVRLADENVTREPEGGPFGAAVFRSDTGGLVAVGMNSVIRLRNSVLHAEVMALMLAHRSLHTHSFAAEGLPPLELVTSCEPCAMCLGATLWSGVKRLVCGAAREDAEALGFDEGPVTEASYRHLEGRGVTVVRGVLRDEARAALARYGELGRRIY